MKPMQPNPDAGSRFSDRRSVPRFAFVAPIDLVEPVAKTHTSGRIIELSQLGCFAEVGDPLAVNSVVQLRIHHGADAFETWARVIYNRSGIGMGLRFMDTGARQLASLLKWLDGLGQDPNSELPPGPTRAYADGAQAGEDQRIHRLLNSGKTLSAAENVSLAAFYRILQKLYRSRNPLQIPTSREFRLAASAC
jgi:hypothetical protein